MNLLEYLTFSFKFCVGVYTSAYVIYKATSLPKRKYIKGLQEILDKTE